VTVNINTRDDHAPDPRMLNTAAPDRTHPTSPARPHPHRQSHVTASPPRAGGQAGCAAGGPSVWRRSLASLPTHGLGQPSVRRALKRGEVRAIGPDRRIAQASGAGGSVYSVGVRPVPGVQTIRPRPASRRPGLGDGPDAVSGDLRELHVADRLCGQGAQRVRSG
jgi:hypothetical protein